MLRYRCGKQPLLEPSAFGFHSGTGAFVVTILGRLLCAALLPIRLHLCLALYILIPVFELGDPCGTLGDDSGQGYWVALGAWFFSFGKRYLGTSCLSTWPWIWVLRFSLLQFLPLGHHKGDRSLCRHFVGMAENSSYGEQGGGAWSKVPLSDGSPQTWRSFQREMMWWQSSLDLEGTKKYNLAARWLLRQSGIVRQRGEEFTPEELSYQKEVVAKDPETGDEVILVEEDPLSGLKKLLKALEGINGRTQLDKRGELRNLFYIDLRRRPGERIAEFCTRFRSLLADLRAEGVSLPSGEVGWFFKNKLGLDGLRLQLLETALGGKEGYEETESEVLICTPRTLCTRNLVVEVTCTDRRRCWTVSWALREEAGLRHMLHRRSAQCQDLSSRLLQILRSDLVHSESSRRGQSKLWFLSEKSPILVQRMRQLKPRICLKRWIWLESFRLKPKPWPPSLMMLLSLALTRRHFRKSKIQLKELLKLWSLCGRPRRDLLKWRRTVVTVDPQCQMERLRIWPRRRVASALIVTSQVIGLEMLSARSLAWSLVGHPNRCRSLRLWPVSALLKHPLVRLKTMRCWLFRCSPFLRLWQLPWRSLTESPKRSTWLRLAWRWTKDWLELLILPAIGLALVLNGSMDIWAVWNMHQSTSRAWWRFSMSEKLSVLEMVEPRCPWSAGDCQQSSGAKCFVFGRL